MLTDPHVPVIGVICEDDPDNIVSFGVSRDAGMQAEDHVRIALGPFRDGRSGYVFAVNPRGARYDSLITSGGDAESVEWDGICRRSAGRSGSWTAGVDFTYQTTMFFGDKNFTVSLWGPRRRPRRLRGNTAAYAFKVDYPNDVWDRRLWHRRVGRDFDPSLGFVSRRGVQFWKPSFMHRPRFARGPIQQVNYGLNPYLWTDLSGQWESYDTQIQVADWLFRSGDGLRVVVSRGRPAAAAVRDRVGRRHCAGALPVGPPVDHGQHRAEAPLLHVAHLGIRDVL